MKLSDSRRLRRVVFGASLVVAPILLGVGDLLERGIDSDNDAKYIANIAAHPTRHYLNGLFTMLGAIALLGAILGLAHLVRTRKPALANVGAPLALAGALGLNGWAVITMGVDHQLAKEPNRAAMVSLYHHANNSSALVPNIVLMFALFLGILVLAVGLWRARAVPRWVAGTLAVGIALLFFASGQSTGLDMAGNALLIVSMGAIGISVLGRSDEEWETGEAASRVAVEPATATA